MNNKNALEDKMREIVGANIDGTITNDVNAIMVALDYNLKIQFLDKAHMKIMSACDFGINWDKMANGPVLFILEGDGSVREPN
jgi:hypothetical protein